MQDQKTVLYAESVDELAGQFDIGLEDPENGEDWALIAQSDSLTALEWIFSGETVVIPTEQWKQIICSYTHCEVNTPENATREVLQMGSEAVFDVKDGQTPLSGIENELASAVASVFVMQANNGIRDWPEIPVEQKVQ